MTPSTTTAVMPIERLTQILAAYGASPQRWPEHERAAAESLRARILAAGSPQERAMLAEALREADGLDDVLSGLSAEVPDAAVARLTAALAFPPAHAPKRSWTVFGLVHAVLRPSAAFAATMAALGIVLGLSVDPAYSSGDGSDYTVAQTADASPADALLDGLSLDGNDLNSNGDAAP
ncbi:MAG TPA: hypothetical protein VGO34_13135 [Alphaproteobacteria bacterium]